MALRHLGFVDLPPHAGPGGFDHAAVHAPTGLTYVAHTANDAVDVFDPEARAYLGSIPGLPAVAGALIPDGSDVVFTSNRGENTVGMFAAMKAGVDEGSPVDKIAVGIRPNGLAFAPRHARLLAAHVGDPTVPGSCAVSVIDVATRRPIADLPVPGRTRWAVYDPVADVFHVNIMDPPRIVVVGADAPIAVRRVVEIAEVGPHGLDIDVGRRRLFCACDGAVLVEVDADRGLVVATAPLSGPPDVVFLNARLARLYVAVGDPGVVDVFDVAPLRRRESMPTEPGAHTLSFDGARDLVCAFLPDTHRAAVYRDAG
jgi:DNA-binding beta-propeller fold protein YncE